MKKQKQDHRTGPGLLRHWAESLEGADDRQVAALAEPVGELCELCELLRLARIGAAAEAAVVAEEEAAGNIDAAYEAEKDLLDAVRAAVQAARRTRGQPEERK